MDIGTQIFWLFILSSIVASISWTVTQEEIFREWRDYCKDKSEKCESTPQRKFFYVFTCEYCFSYWTTLLILILTGFQLLIEDWRGYILAFFTIPWISNQLMSIYRRLRVGIKHEDALATIAKEEVKEVTSEPANENK